MRESDLIAGYPTLFHMSPVDDDHDAWRRKRGRSDEVLVEVTVRDDVPDGLRHTRSAWRYVGGESVEQRWPAAAPTQDDAGDE